MNIKTAIIIPVFNRKPVTLACIRQLKDIIPENTTMEIVIVDDGSSDGTSDAVRATFHDVHVLEGSGDLWWTGGINKGVEFAIKKDFDYVLLLNDDLELDKAFLKTLWDVSNNNPDAMVSSIKLLRREDSGPEIISAGFVFNGWLQRLSNNHQGKLLDEAMLDDVFECETLTGASIIIPIKVFEKVGLLNSNLFPHNWGDLEFTRRANLAGFQCLVASKSHVYTEYNRNYQSFYYLEASRINYIMNLFDITKFSYGYRFLYRESFMHKPFLPGCICFIRGSVRITKNLILKIILPNSSLKALTKKQW